MNCGTFTDAPPSGNGGTLFERMADGRVFTQYHRPCTDVAFNEGKSMRMASSYESRRYLTDNATKLMWGMDGVPNPANCAARVPSSDVVQYCDGNTCRFQRTSDDPLRTGMRRADS